MVKAQVHAGGRGKAGGIRMVEGVDVLEEATRSLLGSIVFRTLASPGWTFRGSTRNPLGHHSLSKNM